LDSGGARLAHPSFLFQEHATNSRDSSVPRAGGCEGPTCWSLCHPARPSGYAAGTSSAWGHSPPWLSAALVDHYKTRGAMDVGPVRTRSSWAWRPGAHVHVRKRPSILQRTFLRFYESGKWACALCHGVSAAKFLMRRRRTSHLVKGGLTVTLISRTSSEDLGTTQGDAKPARRERKQIQPWRIEDALKALGANYVQAGLGADFAVRDGNLIPPASRTSPAPRPRVFIRALGEKYKRVLGLPA